MSDVRSRDEFMHWCGAWALPVFFAERILRAARDVHRAAEVDCSISDEGLRAYWTKRGDAAEKRIRALLADHVARNCAKGGRTWSVEFNGDPRGNCVTLTMQTEFANRLRHATDPCKYGVPAGGFTSVEFASLERLSDARRVARESVR